MKKSEFERRAAQMKIRNLERRRFRNLPPPRSIFEPPRPTPTPVKVHIRDFLRESDIDRLSPELAVIKRLDTLETDRDGLLILREFGLQISVSPELLLRGVRAYDALLKTAVERGWSLKAVEGSCFKISIHGEALELAISENTEPVEGIRVRPGERRQRRPAGSLVVALGTEYETVRIADKRGRNIESKFAYLLLKAEGLANKLRAERDRRAEMKRQSEQENLRCSEQRERIKRLNREIKAWMKAKRIRAYLRAVGKITTKDGTLPAADTKWLDWVHQYADTIDPTFPTNQSWPKE